MTHQPPAAPQRVQPIKAAPETELMQFANLGQSGTIEERSLLLYARDLHGTISAFQRSRQFNELTLRPPRLQAVHHEKDGAGETRGRHRGAVLLGAGRPRRGLILSGQTHPRFPAVATP